MTLQNWKIISKPSQHVDSRGPADGSLTLPQRKGTRQRNKPQVNQHTGNPTPKQDSWWVTELISGTWGQATAHWERSLQSSCHWKTEEKLGRLPNHLVRLRQSLCLNTNTRTGCWRSNTRITKTEILLFLNLEFLCVFVCLFYFLFVCPCVFVHFSLLISLVFFFFVCFISFTILS
jgi:hypothetical protein